MEQWETGIAALKSAYEAWNATKAGSIDTWVSFFSSECELYSLADGHPGLTWTARRETPDGVRAYLQGLTEGFAMHFMHAEEFICQGDTIVVLLRMEWRNKKTGRVMRGPMVAIWRIKDGKAISFREFYDTLAIFDTTAAAPPP